MISYVLYVNADATSIHINIGFACLFVRPENWSAWGKEAVIAELMQSLVLRSEIIFFFFFFTWIYDRLSTNTNNQCPPLLLHEFLCRLDLFVELLDLLVMAVALLVIRIELQALAHLTADQVEGRGKVRPGWFSIPPDLYAILQTYRC